MMHNMQLSNKHIMMHNSRLITMHITLNMVTSTVTAAILIAQGRRNGDTEEENEELGLQGYCVELKK